MLSLKTSPHLTCVATLPCEMSSVLKALITMLRITAIALFAFVLPSCYASQRNTDENNVDDVIMTSITMVLLKLIESDLNLRIKICVRF